MFADDTKLYRTIWSPEDYLILQRDINVSLEWSKYWLLSYNVTKCKVVHIGSAPYVGNYCSIGITRKYSRPWYKS